MSEPSDEELERAERIRRLRSGSATSRSHQRRQQRREQSDDGDHPGGGEADGTDDATGDESGPLTATGDADVLSLAADLPEDGSLFVVPAREGLRRQFNRAAEQLHLRYGFQYDSELDAEQHVRPLALYLGVQALEDSDVEVVKEVLESVDELEAPESDDE